LRRFQAVRELQREVKQLYVELNEKTEALDEARARISELESSSSKAGEEAVIQKTIHTDVDASLNYGYEEELESMRRKLKDCHKEVDGLRETNSRLERLLEQSHPQPSSPAVINVNGGSLYDGMGFADPAEAEYLKNVLYRYMCSRENLGKEAVTLARVIGTVAKFSKSEMDNVISREESRVAGWVGGTVSHVLTGR
ncbi:GRIP domain protein, partial [Teladorsagia circumcincta]